MDECAKVKGSREKCLYKRRNLRKCVEKYKELKSREEENTKETTEKVGLL